MQLNKLLIKFVNYKQIVCCIFRLTITVYFFIDFRIWELVQNYFIDWQHRIKRSNTFSAWMEMQGGIPQGNVLELLLFLVYMNSLPSQ